MKTYRIWFGGSHNLAWIIQEVPELRTVGSVEQIFIHVPCEMPSYIPGPKPNGVVIVTGTLRMEGTTAHFE